MFEGFSFLSVRTRPMSLEYEKDMESFAVIIFKINYLLLL